MTGTVLNRHHREDFSGLPGNATQNLGWLAALRKQHRPFINERSDIMSIQATGTSEFIADEPQAGSFESPYVVFPALILLLIMPLGIVFHPTWLPTIAEIGALTMFGVIFRLMRL